jgi:hypothetical protein
MFEGPSMGPSSAGPRFYPEQKTDPGSLKARGNIFPATLLGGLVLYITKGLGLE